MTSDGPGGAGFNADSVALHLLRGTQAAAMACRGHVGRGDKDAADGAAVAAMRDVLGSVPGRGTVVIGEGEKDDAPMLYMGEEIGTGEGPAFALAVDPLEGTNYCAAGAEGAIAVVAAAPPDTMWSTSGFYMDKGVVGPGAAGAIDVNAPVEDNLRRVAEALGKPLDELVTIILAKPRHEELIVKVREAGASVIEIPDGDVMGSLRVLVPGGGVDVALGVGGTPEGVLTACAVRALGGDMQAKLAPQDDEEREKLEGGGVDIDKVLTLDDLVSSDECAFVATAVTATVFLPAPKRESAGWRVSSFVVTPRHPAAWVSSLLRDDGSDES
jgi:fructose-1,6-bisphosphatase II